MEKHEKILLSGNDAAVMGAIAGGAEFMFGYPITPATEILQSWVARADKDRSIDFLQAEDETSAGFLVCGAISAGKKAFTATAGPGHVLMQDPISMAENLRLPFVGIMMQRGGPSTGTVNFSQQEVNLASFGGNGDGLRVVYSAASVTDMYEYSAKIFSTAWKYRFPTMLLGDGYLGKMKESLSVKKLIRPVIAEPILKEAAEPTFLRNCYSTEEEFNERLNKNIEDWKKMVPKIVESESYKTADAETVLIAHGLVSEAAKDAVDMMREKGKKVGLFRPITVHPIDNKNLKKAIRKAKKIFIIEAAFNQFSRMIKYELFGEDIKTVEISKPAAGFVAEEILEKIN